jgi:hypothetical protein
VVIVNPEVGDIVYVHGDYMAEIVHTDVDGAIVRELDDDSETWFSWKDLEV